MSASRAITGSGASMTGKVTGVARVRKTQVLDAAAMVADPSNNLLGHGRRRPQLVMAAGHEEHRAADAFDGNRRGSGIGYERAPVHAGGPDASEAQSRQAAVGHEGQRVAAAAPARSSAATSAPDPLEHDRGRHDGNQRREHLGTRGTHHERQLRALAGAEESDAIA